MKLGFSIFVAIVCSAVGFARAGQSNAPAKPASAFEQNLMNAENGFIEAAKKGDVAFFKRTLTDDFSFVEFDGQLYSRQDMIDQFSEAGTNIMPYEMKVIPLGDDAGIVTYNVVLRVPAVEDQGPPPRYQHFSTTWVKQDGTWRMKFLQMTANHWGDW
jgi:hypothetical protein